MCVFKISDVQIYIIQCTLIPLNMKDYQILKCSVKEKCRSYDEKMNYYVPDVYLLEYQVGMECSQQQESGNQVAKATNQNRGYNLFNKRNKYINHFSVFTQSYI